MTTGPNDSQQYYPNPTYNPSTTIHAHYLQRILTARVYDVASQTPLSPAPLLSSKLQNTVLLKREDLQPVFSFKLRGAFNKIISLSPQEKQQGILACSAGNHAQGVALASKTLGIESTIVMPLATPAIKYENCKRMGANVVLFGDDFDACGVECQRLSIEKGLTLIHPFDDVDVIAGQGTIAMEILRQIDLKKLDYIFVCVGGGGLLAGISAYVKAIAPSIKIIGCEAVDAAGMTVSILAQERTALKTCGLFADGAAVKLVGAETFNVCKNLVDGMVLVSTDEICAAIKDVFGDTRAIIEPAGALGVAGMKAYIRETKITGMTCIAICSGANMNFDRLGFVAERADLGESKEALISIVVPEKPGSFIALYNTLHPRAVTEFSYRYGDAKEAHIFMSFTLDKKNSNDIQTVFTKLKQLGMYATDLSGDELAKTHARYLVGGRKEVERPGALHHFLTTLTAFNKAWNVSLFHYRNYGGDIGKVLVGIQVETDSTPMFNEFLENLNYEFVEETDNSVCQRFLK